MKDLFQDLKFRRELQLPDQRIAFHFLYCLQSLYDVLSRQTNRNSQPVLIYLSFSIELIECLVGNGCCLLCSVVPDRLAHSLATVRQKVVSVDILYPTSTLDIGDVHGRDLGLD